MEEVKKETSAGTEAETREKIFQIMNQCLDEIGKTENLGDIDALNQKLEIAERIGRLYHIMKI